MSHTERVKDHGTHHAAITQKTEQQCIYLDWNATTPIFPEVAASMLPFLSHFGNPSSTHPYGRTCKAAVEHARQQVAHLIGARLPEEIHFCSCGTEADNWAIWGAVAAYRRAHRDGSGSTVLPHVVASAIEHPAILEQLSALSTLGLLEFTLVEVDSQGIVNVDEMEAAIRDTTCLITLMHSNNEVGALQPVAAVAKIAKERGVLMHCDAAQSIGKVPVNVMQELECVDMLTVVGHKFGAPKGVAALYVREGFDIDRLMCGGGQERGKRGGTENVLLIVGLGKAAEIAALEMSQNRRHMQTLRDLLQQKLTSGAPQGAVRVNGPLEPHLRLPNTLNISFRWVESSSLLAKLSEEVAASAGAACHSDEEPRVSGVLQAMHVPLEWAMGAVRLSVGRHSTEGEVTAAAEILLKKVLSVGCY